MERTDKNKAEFKSWKEFIKHILIKSGKFEFSTVKLKNEAEIEIYKSTNINSQTEIRIGYLKNDLLIYLHIYNPSVPGYNKYVEGEYFYQYQFNKPADYGNPALEYNEQNRNGILSILKNGLKGKEIQYVKSNKIIKSKLFIVESDLDFYYSYDFRDRNILTKIFGKKIDKIDGIIKREIELNKIFNGI